VRPGKRRVRVRVADGSLISAPIHKDYERGIINKGKNFKYFYRLEKTNMKELTWDSYEPLTIL
jgi:hypothetical protein